MLSCWQERTLCTGTYALPTFFGTRTAPLLETWLQKRLCRYLFSSADEATMSAGTVVYLTCR